MHRLTINFLKLEYALLKHFCSTLISLGVNLLEHRFGTLCMYYLFICVKIQIATYIKIHKYHYLLFLFRKVFCTIWITLLRFANLFFDKCNMYLEYVYKCNTGFGSSAVSVQFKQAV